MFERFTDGARNVMSRSMALAEEERSPNVRRHHMLLALLDDAQERGEAIPAQILADADVDLAGFRAAVLASLHASEEPAPGDRRVSYSSGAKKAIELGLREALSLGHNYIGCEHLLLAILRSADGPLATTIGGTNLHYGTAREFLRTYSPGRSRRRFRGLRGVAFAGDRVTRGVETALDRARKRAGLDRPLTTGDLLVALSEGGATHFAQLVGELPADLAARADALVADGVADGEVESVRIDPRSGAVTVTDPDLAEKVKSMSPDAIAAALRKAVGGE